MARTISVRLGGQQGPVAYTRNVYSSAAVTDGGLVGASSVAMADGLGVRGGVSLSTVTPPDTTGTYLGTYTEAYT